MPVRSTSSLPPSSRQQLKPSPWFLRRAPSRPRLKPSRRHGPLRSALGFLDSHTQTPPRSLSPPAPAFPTPIEKVICKEGIREEDVEEPKIDMRFTEIGITCG